MTARNDDRFAVNTQDGLELSTSQPDNYLGNPECVNDLVRSFFSSVFSERARYHNGADGADSAHRLSELCKSYGKVIMGMSDRYKAQPWNAPTRLGAMLRALLPDVNEYDNPGDAYFNFLAVQALNAAIALEEGHMSEDAVKANIEEVVQDAVERILGRGFQHGE